MHVPECSLVFQMHAGALGGQMRASDILELIACCFLVARNQIQVFYENRK